MTFILYENVFADEYSTVQTEAENVFVWVQVVNFWNDNNKLCLIKFNYNLSLFF